MAHHSSEFLNYLWNPDFIVWGSETVRHVLYGKIQKRKSYNDCSPSKPNRTKKRQDDVLSFQKITGSYYHFIAYLSLLNDRPNSFYHLNFNFFRILVTEGGTFVFNIKFCFFQSQALSWMVCNPSYLFTKEVFANICSLDEIQILIGLCKYIN